MRHGVIISWIGNGWGCVREGGEHVVHVVVFGLSFCFFGFRSVPSLFSSQEKRKEKMRHTILRARVLPFYIYIYMCVVGERGVKVRRAREMDEK